MKAPCSFLAVLVLVFTGLAILGSQPLLGGCTAETTEALLLDWCAHDSRWSWCSAVDTVYDALRYWGIGTNPGEVYADEEVLVTDNPTITISVLEDELVGRRVAYLASEGGQDAGAVYFRAELYATEDARDSVGLFYIHNRGYEDFTEIAGNTDSSITPWVYSLVLTDSGVQNHLSNRMADESFVHAAWCYSAGTAGCWGEETFLGYSFPVAWDRSCNDLRKVWSRLRCREYPRFRPEVYDAAMGTKLVTGGPIPDNRLDCYRDCKNPITRFSGVGVFGNTVWWETEHEDGSEEFMVRGYSSVDSDPEELAVVPARGGERLGRRYWLEVPGDYERYDVVECDRWGRTTLSARLPRGERPSDWEEWVSEPKVEMDVAERVTDRKPLVEMVDGESVAIELRVSGGLPGTQDSPPSDALCADVVVYTSSQSLLWEAQAHLDREGLKHRLFLGTKDPEDARTAYSVVLQANSDYESACQSYPGGCGRTYPVSPGPLLIIVGDGQSGVYHLRVPVDDGRCLPYTHGCRSDLDITDVDGDGIPEGPVTRVPADESSEVYYACHAAEDFNHGRYVDESLRLMTIIGDCSQDDSSRCGGWPIDLAEDIQTAYLDMGFDAHPMLRVSDYLPYFPSDSKQEACRNQVNAGMVELWGVDTDETEQARWPGCFFWKHDYDVSQLTRRQRYIAWLPSCKTVSTWDSGTVPFAETFMFNNYPDRTMMVGAVGHLHGGWTMQHEDFARMLLEERMAAAPGTPIARIAYDAVIRAQTEESHLFNYARSVGVVGAYVTLPDFYCEGGEKECQVTSPGDGAVFTKGMMERIDWRMCLGETDGERIAKHVILESRDDGVTWSSVVDSVDASARRYLWYVSGESSDLCRVKVVTFVEEYDSSGGDWVPAYTCECVSDVFSIVPGGGSYPDPCPHLFVWRETGFELVNSVLRHDRGLRQPKEDHVALNDVEPDEAGLVHLRIDEIEPDTAYIHGIGLGVLPGAGEVMVTPDGDILKVGKARPPIAATLEGRDVLSEIADSDGDCLLGAEGTTVTVTLPGLEATEATLVICHAKKDLPELPFGQEGTHLTGLEIRMIGSGSLLSGGDTTTSAILHPRQFLSTTALALTGVDPAAESLVVDVVWHSEHHLDALWVSPKVETHIGEGKTLSPVRVKHVTTGDVAVGEGAWPVRLVPGDQLYLDFKPEGVSYLEGAAYLLSLEGYFVRPREQAGMPERQLVSLDLASPNPCTGSTLTGCLAIPSATHVSLEIYDVRGRLVRQIMDTYVEAGIHRFEWDLKDGKKEQAASGLYFLRLETPMRAIVAKVVLSK